MDRPLRALLWLMLALSATSGVAAGQEAVTSVWKERQLHFSYRGFAAVYPCSVLQNRVALVLTAIGARPDLSVTVNHCDTSFASGTVAATGNAGWPRSHPDAAGGYPTAARGQASTVDAYEPGGGYYRRSEPGQVVDVRVSMSVPVEVTAEVMAELKTDRKRRELISQVTGDPLPLFDNPILFPAQRQVVTLSRDTGLEAADCELLDQMASSVFRDLGVRIVGRSHRCDRGSMSRISPSLEVEAFLPVTTTGRAPKDPAPGDARGDSHGVEDEPDLPDPATAPERND